jgi:hypothetical protein
MPIRARTARPPIKAPAIKPAEGLEDPAPLPDELDVVGVEDESVDRAEAGSVKVAEPAAALATLDKLARRLVRSPALACVVITLGWNVALLGPPNTSEVITAGRDVARTGAPVTTPREFVCCRRVVCGNGSMLELVPLIGVCLRAIMPSKVEGSMRAQCCCIEASAAERPS